MRLKRLFIVGLAALGLAACAGPAPTKSSLDQATRDNIKIVDVDVDVSKLGATTQGRQVSASNVRSLVKQSAAGMLKGQGHGRRPVRANLEVESVNIITAGQSILVGGESTMRGTIELVDAKTGTVLLPAKAVTSGGGGWAAGGLIAVATRDDAMTESRQLAQEFVARARILVFGNGMKSASAAKKKTTANASNGVKAPSGDKTTVKQAQRKAEIEARQKHDSTCHTLACEDAVKRARKEAALTSN